MANFIKNGNFESWSAGNTSAPDEWTATGADEISGPSGGYRGSYNAFMRNNLNQQAKLYQQVSNRFSSPSTTIYFGAWVRTNASNRVRLGITADGSDHDSAYCPNDDVWHFITCSYTVTTGNTVWVYLKIESGTMERGEIDGAILQIGEAPLDFAPRALEDGGPIYGDLDFRNYNKITGLGHVNLIQNGSFESWSAGVSNQLPDHWATYGSPSDISKDTGERDGFGGYYVVKITVGPAGSNAGIYITLSNLRPSTTYKVRCRAKANSGDIARICSYGSDYPDLDKETNATVWTTLEGTFKTTGQAGNIDLKLLGKEAEDIVWFDQLTVVESVIPAFFLPYNLTEQGGEVYADLSLVKGVGITDKDKDTKIQLEESLDEDKIRFDTAGTERMVIDSSGIDVKGNKITNLAAPVTNGDAIRRTTKITEANLEDAVDKKHNQSHGSADHSGNIGTESQITFDTNSGHDHDGTDSKTVDHVNLTNKGTNTHVQIDSFISSKGQANGIASLDTSAKVPVAQLPDTIYIPSELAGYKYRKSITINGSSDCAQTNYQMKLVIHRTTGTAGSPNANDVYVGTNGCQFDYDDIRFTTSDGMTLLDYWIERINASPDYAIVWVEFDSIPVYPYTATFYMYYGNASATAYSNGDNTFIFFDHFPGNSLDTTNKWTVITGSPSVANSILTFPYDAQIYSKTAFPVNRRFRASMYYAANNSLMWFGLQNTSNYGVTFVSQWPTANNLAADSRNPWPNDKNSVLGTIGAGAYNTFEILRNSTTNVKYYLNDDLKATISGAEVPTDTITIEMRGYAQNLLSDWVFIPNYTVNEPAISAWGGELTLANLPFINANMASMISGCRPKYKSDDANAIYIEKGQLVIGGRLANLSTDLTVDWTNNWDTDRGDGNKDQANRWYYLYLVKPSTEGGTPTAKITDIAPSASTTGNAKYHPTKPTWRYVGSFYNDSSSNIRRFEVRGNKVYLDNGYSLVAGGTATTYTSLNSELCKYVPNIVVAKEVLISLYVLSGNVADANRLMYISSDSSGYQKIYLRYRTYSTADYHQSGGNAFYMPLNSNQDLWYKMDIVSMSGYVDIFGYTEEY